MMPISVHGNIHVVRPGTTPFRSCWELQKRLLDLRAIGAVPDTLIMTEHPAVYTIGRTGNPNNMLAGMNELQAAHIEFLSIERGGDVTYHGPGQLVGYPILNLLDFHPDLHWYVRSLEEVVIRTLSHYRIEGERHPQFTGVWVGNAKVCAIGIHTRGWVTMHGFALNVSTDVSAFDRIVPCGIRGKDVTSISLLLGRKIDFVEVESLCIQEFCTVFGYSPLFITRESLADVINEYPLPGRPSVKEFA